MKIHFRHEELQIRLSQRRAALIPNSRTVAEIKYAAARVAGKTALASIRLRKPIKDRFA